jgi:hypothetical protein
MLGGGSGTIRRFTCGADLLVMDATAPTLVAARSFDSRWRWTEDRKDSPLVPVSIKTHADFATAMGVAICRAAGADLGMARLYAAPTEAPFVPGTTRVSDVMPLFYFSPVGVAEMSGSELAEAARRFAAAGESSLIFCKTSEIKASGLMPASTYRVAFPIDLLWRFSEAAKMAPRNCRHTDLGVAEALERFLAETGQ